MNQPTWEDFQRLESEQQQLKEDVRIIKEQITEPIKVTVERREFEVERRLDNHTEMLREISQKQDKFSTDIGELKIDAKAYTGDAAIFKNKVERMELDVSEIKEDVGILKTDVNTLKSDVATLKTDMEQVKATQNGHSKYFEHHGKRLQQIETDMSAVKADITSIRSTQEEILRLLRER